MEPSKLSPLRANPASPALTSLPRLRPPRGRVSNLFDDLDPDVLSSSDESNTSWRNGLSHRTVSLPKQQRQRSLTPDDVDEEGYGDKGRIVNYLDCHAYNWGWKMVFTERDTEHLRAALQEAVVKCSERCLYQSAKWAAELLTSIPPAEDDKEPEDSQMTEVPNEGVPPIVVTGNQDPGEALLEAKEINQYLLAKSFFDCREYDRCAAVFLPDTILSGILSTASSNGAHNTSTPRGKGKAKTTAGRRSSIAPPKAPRLSQKSIFLALYAKFMSGEKKKDEDSEMVMGPHDGGTAVNKQLVVISRFLKNWFDEHTNEAGEAVGSQGWLEYLYGMVLAKDKSEEEAMRLLLRSVRLFPMNWGCWLEMTSLVGRVDDLNRLAPHLPQNIMSFIFHLHTSLELYQSTPTLSTSLDQLLAIFPTSPFLLAFDVAAVTPVPVPVSPPPFPPLPSSSEDWESA